MKRVCHISTVHFPNDDRIFYKECVSLEILGYEVFFIVKNPVTAVVRNIRFVSLPEYKNRIFRMIRGPQKAYHVAKKIDAEVYHFHDPELILTGLKLKKLNKKVIYDVHENVFEQIESKLWLGPFVKILQSLYLKFEQIAVRKFDYIIVATDSIQENFNKRYPDHRHKFKLIRNYSILSLIDSVRPISLNTDRQKLIYLGGLSKIRGIKEIICALELMAKPPELILFGKWEDEAYRAECQSLQGWKYVRYMGFKNLEEIYPYLKSSDIGLALLYPEKNYLKSLPVKAFEYMAMSKPMILSDFPYWKEIFGNCAIFVNPFNPADIAEKITELLINQEFGKQLGWNGRKAVEEKFSWEAEVIKLAEIYSNLAENDHKSN